MASLRQLSFLCCQVSELYDLVTKWEPVADSLPHITERLSALEQLHEQGTVQVYNCVCDLSVISVGQLVSQLMIKQFYS